jgi:TonB family protein
MAGVDLRKGEYSMRLAVASFALAATFILAPVAAGYAPALCQDFSITNQVEPANPGRRDLTRQLQAWWDAHAYYPKHASNNDEGGTVKVHLVILPSGKIWTINVVESSGSRSLDSAGSAVFRDVFVRPFSEGEPKAEMDVSLHYVLAHRHDQPVAAGYTPVLSKSPFTIMNDPVKSPILDTMLQRTCTGTVVVGGTKNRPWSGIRSGAQAIFFRKPDGTPWVKFNKGGWPSLSPVTEVGKMVQWTGHVEYFGGSATNFFFPQYTAWLDGDNRLSGTIGSRFVDNFGVPYNQNGGYVDLTCATEVEPTITWSNWNVDTRATPPGDPP